MYVNTKQIIQNRFCFRYFRANLKNRLFVTLEELEGW